MTRLLSSAIYGLSVVLGLVAYGYPLFASQAQAVPPAELAGTGALRLTEGPLLTAAIMAITLGAMLLEVQGQVVNAKIIATLGLLVAVAAVLRFIETAIPGPGGFSPVFVPIILAGYVFGARFGFLMGTLTILTSALITGGVGPWLPFQMFAAGWMGITAAWLPELENPAAERITLAAFAFAWGLLFGAILNLYFWPFFEGEAVSSWRPGDSPGEMLTRYGTFYLTTSLGWDLLRGIGNGILILALGTPAVRSLTRFRDRFQFQFHE